MSELEPDWLTLEMVEDLLSPTEGVQEVVFEYPPEGGRRYLTFQGHFATLLDAVDDAGNVRHIGWLADDIYERANGSQQIVVQHPVDRLRRRMAETRNSIRFITELPPELEEQMHKVLPLLEEQ